LRQVLDHPVSNSAGHLCPNGAAGEELPGSLELFDDPRLSPLLLSEHLALTHGLELRDERGALDDKGFANLVSTERAHELDGAPAADLERFLEHFSVDYRSRRFLELVSDAEILEATGLEGIQSVPTLYFVRAQLCTMN